MENGTSVNGVFYVFADGADENAINEKAAALRDGCAAAADMTLTVIPLSGLNGGQDGTTAIRDQLASLAVSSERIDEGLRQTEANGLRLTDESAGVSLVGVPIAGEAVAEPGSGKLHKGYLAWTIVNFIAGNAILAGLALMEEIYAKKDPTAAGERKCLRLALIFNAISSAIAILLIIRILAEALL